MKSKICDVHNQDVENEYEERCEKKKKNTLGITALVIGTVFTGSVMYANAATCKPKVVSPIYYYDNNSAYAQLTTEAYMYNGEMFREKSMRLSTNLSLSSSNKWVDIEGKYITATFTGTSPNYHVVSGSIKNQH